jgi:DNA invertase Pin-like site-specific DNA recombinase
MARPIAYAYTRFSTPEQSHGDSRRRQTKLAEDYAAAHGLTLDDKLTFRDLGVSAYQGRNARTGQLGDFLRAVEAGLVAPGSSLLVESLDRVSRRFAMDALDVLRDICRQGVKLVTLTDGRIYTHESLRHDFMSLMMSLMVFQRAHEESATKAKRLRSAWAGKRERIESGEKLTAKVPGWLWLDKKSGKIKPHPDRAAVVRRIFRMTLKGVGKHSVAETLNSERVPVFGRGKYWHRSYVAKILASSTVVGTLTPHVFSYDDETGKRSRKALDAIPDYYPQVIDTDDFQRVQSLQESANPSRGRHAATSEIRNLFGGLGRCPSCGGMMSRVYKGKPPKGGTYLVCAKARLGAGCRYRVVRYGPLEAAFIRDSARLLNDAPSGKSAEAVNIDKEVRNIEGSLLALPNLIDNLVNAIARGRKSGASSEALEERLRDLEAEREPLRTQLARARQKQATTSGKLVSRKCEELEEALAQSPMNRAAVNALMRQLFEGIAVDAVNGRLLLEWRHGGQSEIMFAWPKGRPKATRPSGVRVRRMAS